MDDKSPLAAENFDLRCRIESLTSQLEQLAGGASGVALHEELISARKVLESKEAELSELNELFCSVEREMMNMRTERDSAAARAATVSGAAADVESHRTAAAAAVRGRAEALATLATEAFGTRLLRMELSNAEERAERACLERAECLASLSLSREAAAQALSRGVRGRDELSEELRTAQAEAARQQGAVGALETRVTDLTAELASVRQQAETDREKALASEALVGRFKVEATGGNEAKERALANASTARQTANEARAACVAAEALAAERAAEIEQLRSELDVLRTSAQAESTAASFRASELEEASKKVGAVIEEQRAASDAASATMRAALEEASAARAAAVEDAAQGRQEIEALRQELASSQAQSKAEVTREAERARIQVATSHKERHEALTALQRRCDEHIDARSTAEAKSRAAQAEAHRLSKFEKQAAAMDDKCRKLQAELDKKQGMLERVYRRRGSVESLPPVAPPPAPPPVAPLAEPPAPPPVAPPEETAVDSSGSSSTEPVRALPLPSSVTSRMSSASAIVPFADEEDPPPPPPPRESRAPAKSGVLSSRSSNVFVRREPSPRPGDTCDKSSRASLGCDKSSRASSIGSFGGCENAGGVTVRSGSSGRGRAVKHVESRFMAPHVRKV